jgi:uncharacterized membrane protein YedE/YeeE
LKGLIFVFLSGIIFAIGLGVSGMTDANKVIGFLNVAGSWDPALAFVMVGAIGAHLATFKLVTGRPSPLFATKFHLPTNQEINTKLAIGSSLFGIGWGLGGFCPGPGIVSVTSGAPMALSFTGSLIVGMLLFNLTNKMMTVPVESAQGET